MSISTASVASDKTLVSRRDTVELRDFTLDGSVLSDIATSESATAQAYGSHTSSSDSGSHPASTYMDEMSELDDMLHQGHLQQKGCFGALERLPLFFKMFLMLVISLLGILAIGLALCITQGIVIRTQKTEKLYANGVIECAELINELSKERELSSLFLTNNDQSAKFESDLKAQRLAVDKGLLSFKRMAQKYHWTSQLLDFQRSLLMMTRIRGRVTRKQMNPTDTVNYYTTVISTITNFMLTLTDSRVRYKFGLDVMVLLTVNAGLTRSIGSIVFSEQKFQDTQQYQRFIEYNANENAMKQFLTPVVGSKVMQQYEDMLSQYDVRYNQMLQYALENPNERLNIDPGDWYEIAVSRVDQMLNIQKILASIVRDDSDRYLRNNTAAICIVVVAVFVFWVTAAFTAWIFSRAITGPWRRLINIQEATINKFVPKDFMRLVKVYKIADLTLGKTAKRDMAVLFMRIKGFTKLLEDMKPNEAFNFLNKYLENVGPVVRKYGGYIDKFIGEGGLMAVFSSYTAAIRCSLELQELMREFNSRNLTMKENPQVETGVGLATGKVVVGTVGEHDRIDGLVTSETVLLADRLEKLARAFRTGILTSKSALRKLKTDQIHLFARPLGYIRTNDKKKQTKIVEILDQTDKRKMETLQLFIEAVNNMQKHEYQRALELFDRVIEVNPSDYAAARVREDCEKAMNSFNREVSKIAVVSDLLSYSSLWDDFEQFCRDEQSDENFKFWMAIEQEYHKAETEEERYRAATHIINFYLVEDAPFKVNTSDSKTSTILKAVNEYRDTGAAMNRNLFREIKSEIENLMSDTFTRYKRTPRIRSILQKNLGPCLLRISDEDTM